MNELNTKETNEDVVENNFNVEPVKVPTAEEIEEAKVDAEARYEAAQEAVKNSIESNVDSNIENMELSDSQKRMIENIDFSKEDIELEREKIKDMSSAEMYTYFQELALSKLEKMLSLKGDQIKETFRPAGSKKDYPVLGKITNKIRSILKSVEANKDKGLAVKSFEELCSKVVKSGELSKFLKNNGYKSSIFGASSYESFVDDLSENLLSSEQKEKLKEISDKARKTKLQQGNSPVSRGNVLANEMSVKNESYYSGFDLKNAA